MIIKNKLIGEIQGGARNVTPLIVHITHFYFYKSILHLVRVKENLCF